MEAIRAGGLHNQEARTMTMQQKEVYATVSSEGCDEEATDLDIIEDEHVPVRARTNPWRSALVLVATFLAGLALGSSSSRLVASPVRLVAGSTSSSSSSSSSSNSEKCGDTDSVSYEFLHTARGASLQETLHEELVEQGPKAALEHAKSLIDKDDQIASSCHPLIHVLGRNALRELGFDEAFGGMLGTPDAPLLRICNAAYMHGIIEHHLVASDNLMDDVTMISDNICSKLTDVAKGEWECRHGVGHGMIQHFRGIRDREALAEAVTACGKTKYAKDCENGLWMDHYASTRVSEQLEPSSLEVCSLAKASPWSCAFYSPTEFILHYPRAYKEALQYCQDGFDGNSAHICITGVAMQVAKENQHNYLPVEIACLSAPEHEQRAFFAEAIHYYTTNTGQSKLPPSLCENLVVFKSQCMSHT